MWSYYLNEQWFELIVDAITLRRSVVIVFCKLYVGKTPFGGPLLRFMQINLYTLRSFVLHTEVVLSSEVVKVSEL